MHTILFVDDELDVLEVLRRLFERNHEVICVSSGAQALEVLGQRQIDLLVTDQRMPQMSGIELLRQVRERGHDVLAILLTAYTQPQDIIAAVNKGQVYRYLTKPFEVHELLHTVSQALEVVSLKRDQARLLETLRKRMEAINVLHEVNRASVTRGTGPEALIEQLLSVVGRVLPHDASAVLLDPGANQTAALRIRQRTALSEQGLLAVKDSVLLSHRKAAGVVLPEERVLTRLDGATSPAPSAASSFPSSLQVPLVARGRTLGTLALFCTRDDAYSSDDGELLDLIVNQTLDTLGHLRAAEAEQRSRVEQLVQALGDGVLLTDEKNDLVVVNPAALKLLGLAEHPSGKALDDRLGFSAFELVRTGGVRREELEVDGRPLEVTVSPVLDAQGTLKGAALLVRDLSERAALEQRKDEFVNVVSHELRTPLTSITGALDLVLNHITGDINEKQRRFLEMARESTEKLNALVDDLLDLGKAARGKMKMAFELTRLDELARRAVEKYGPAFAEHQVQIAVDAPAETLKLLGDPNRLTQVLNNLLTNAVHFTPEGGRVVVALGAPAAVPGYVMLSVTNTGQAIADDDLERIFDRFEQARNRAQGRHRGTGLGLSICRNIVEAHGGKIWAEPHPAGARFVVTLPVEPALTAGAAEPDEAHERRPTRGTVLVVEDSPEVAFVVKAMLLSRQLKVVVATSGEEALLLARKVKPDVITLDIRLPDIDGLKLAEIFRHDADTHTARVMVISGFDEREASLRAGARAFLKKPVQPDALFTAIEGLLENRGQRRGRVLIVDDDAQIRAIAAEVLGNLGYECGQAPSLAAARDAIREARPDLLLLDISLPDGEGFDFFEELKAERAGVPISVIFVSAQADTQAKVRALKLGGDDYLTKPFDALELAARAESVLRRKADDGQQGSPLRLPGSAAIERDVNRRVAARQRFAFCYLDLDNLKAYNDYYGFAKADGVVRQTADLLREIFGLHAAPGDFLGHVAGDDFVFVCSLETVDQVCRRLIEAFDRIIPLYYDRVDRERGHIEADDRFGERRKFPVMSVSVVAVIADGTRDHAALARHAADLKKKAKAVPGSIYLRSDRLEAGAVAESA
ncbi:MAG: response regulator [Myxococcaceae bacterium]|nr:response regulator [Myxococcaceae bacterium]